MSEIKGQLLGIVLVLVIFGAVSAGLAAVFTNTSKQITEKSKSFAEDVDDLMTYNDTNPTENTEGQN